MLMTKTLSVIVFREEPPFTLMVFNVGDVTCRHRFPSLAHFRQLGSSMSLCLLIVFQIGDLYQARHGHSALRLLCSR